MSQVDIGQEEPAPPLVAKPAGITVKVFVNGVPFGEVVGERPIPADARQVARQVLAEAEMLLKGPSHVQ